MPVVINEFEVVPQVEPTNRQTETGQTAALPPKPDKREVEKIEERFRERMLRVWAH
jgi:hypothetical protein